MTAMVLPSASRVALCADVSIPFLQSLLKTQVRQEKLFLTQQLKLWALEVESLLFQRHTIWLARIFPLHHLKVGQEDHRQSES